MNKQSNTYTIIYIIVLVVVVGAALAFTALSLKPQQTANANADKMKQILASVHVTATAGDDVAAEFARYIPESFAVDADGNRVEGVDAFGIDVAAQSKLPAAERVMPVYRCEVPGQESRYILALSGSGLWGPIWGYVSVDADGSTIYGAFFAHQGETPGLGAEIEKPAFSDQFDGKRLVKGGELLPVNVLKQGQQPMGGEDYVDAISGGTITSKGVASMLDNCLQGYKAFLATLAKADTDNNDNAQ